MADNTTHVERHPLEVLCDNERSATPDTEPKDLTDDNEDSKGRTAHTHNVTTAVDSTPDGATTEPMQSQTQMERGM